MRLHAHSDILVHQAAQLLDMGAPHQAMNIDHTLSLQQQIVRLEALLEASRQIHSTIQLDEVLRRALEIIVRELEMDGAFFTGFPFSEGRIPPRFLLSCDTSDLSRGCARFPLVDKASKQLTDLIVIPRQGVQLSLEESDFLQSLAVQTAVAIENARHHERIVHLQRVEQDLASARAIQRSLLPHSVPAIPGYRTAWRSISCYEVGGDYLDVVPLASGEQIMIVADVAGKGLASAMVATSFRAAFRAMATAGLPLLQIATQLNSLHFAEGSEAQRRFVTALFLRLDPKEHTVEAVNAGHNPGLLFAPKSKHPVFLEPSSTPVGMLPEAAYTSEVHDLKEGVRLLAYTDGLTEIFRGEDEFGIERLAETFYACRAQEGDAVLDHIWRTLEAFSTETEPRDDMTALVLMRQ
jgi:serine phosphatase RsbU (regulator of sigma subunit)